MPYKIVKNRGKNTFRVINSKTKKIKAKSTTLKKAKKQVRLLYLLERNPNFKTKTIKLRKKNKI
jgi:hypothetical protein